MTDDELRVLVDARLSNITHAYAWSDANVPYEELMTALLWSLHRHCENIEHVNAILALSDDAVMELVVLSQKHYKLHVGAGSVSVWIDTNVAKCLAQVPGATICQAWRVVQQFMQSCLAQGIDPLDGELNFTQSEEVAKAFVERELAKAQGKEMQ